MDYSNFEQRIVTFTFTVAITSKFVNYMPFEEILPVKNIPSDYFMVVNSLSEVNS